MSWRLSKGVKPKECIGCPRYSRGIGFVPPDGKPDNSETIVGIGRHPGPVEARIGRPYSGGSGRLLDNLLVRAGLSRSRVCMTNLVKCGGPDPLPDEVSYCIKTYLADELQGRKCIVTLGALPAKVLTGIEKVKNERGTVHQFAGIPLVITLEPAGLLWSKGESKNVGESRDYLPIVIKDLVKVKRIAAGHAEVSVTQEVYAHPTEAQVETELDLCEQSEQNCIDIETNFPEGDGRTITMIGLSSKPGRGVTLVPALFNKYRERIQRILKNKDKRLVGFNIAQFDEPRMIENGWEMGNQIVDGMLADHLVESDMGDFGLEAVVSRHLDYAPWKHLSNKDPLRNVLDVARTHELQYKLDARMEDLGNRALLFSHQIPMARLCYKATEIGIRVDEQAMMKAKLGCMMIIQRLEEELKQKYPLLNWNSHQQLKKLFYEEMKLPTQFHRSDRKKVTTDHYALDDLIKICEANMEWQVHGSIVKAISELRQYSKYANTFLSGEDIHPDGRFHPPLLLHRQVTGRGSAQDPNIMQLPKGLIRSMILPDAPDWVIIKADFSQIQMRLIGWFASDSVLNDRLAFYDANPRDSFGDKQDVHRLHADRFYGDTGRLNKTKRSLSKNMYYGVSFGQGAPGLATMYGVEESQAKAFIDFLWSEYPRTKAWRDGILNSIEERNYLRDPYGRIRWLWNRNFATEAFIALPQMTEASMMFESAILLDKIYQERYSGMARVMFWVHDEIVTTCHESIAEEVAQLKQEVMSCPREKLDGFRCPAEATIGRNYDEACYEEGLAGDWRRLRRTVR